MSCLFEDSDSLGRSIVVVLELTWVLGMASVAELQASRAAAEEKWIRLSR